MARTIAHLSLAAMLVGLAGPGCGAGADTARITQAQQAAAQCSPPEARLLYQEIGTTEGALFLRDLPAGERWDLWQWRIWADEWVVPIVHCAVAPDRRHAIITEERHSRGTGGRSYVFALLDLEQPWEEPKVLETPEGLGDLAHPPVWRNSSTIVFGVARDVLGKKGYRELMWAGDFASPARDVPQSAAFCEQYVAREVERAREALGSLPEAMVPSDIQRAMGAGRLILSSDGATVTLRGFERLIKSHVSVSPSRKSVAVSGQGDVLRIFDTGGLLRHAVRPLDIFPQEIVLFHELRWSPDEGWLLFTERHYQTVTPPPTVAHPPSAVQSLALVRAVHLESGAAFTLVAGENAFWIRGEEK